MLLLKLNSLNSKRCLAFLLLFSLVFGCSAKFFSVSAATIAPNVSVGKTGVGVHNGGWSFSASGTGDNVNTIVLYQLIDVTDINTIDISWTTVKERYSDGAWFQWGWWLASVDQFNSVGSADAQYPYCIWYDPQSSRFTMRAGGKWLTSVSFDVSALSGQYYLFCGGYFNFGGSFDLSIADVVVTDDSVPPVIDIPDYSGGVGGSSNSIVQIQQGFRDQGVSIDTSVSQLGAEIISDEIFVYPNDLDGQQYEKISMRMGLLVTCTVTNSNAQYAWLNDSYIGFQPSFASAVPGNAEMMSSYSLSDVYYASPGFVVSTAQNGVIAFRFDDSTYYMGRLYLKPYATVSAAGILYFTCDIICPYNGAGESIWTSEALSGTAMFGGNTLTGITGVEGLLNNVPSSPSDTGGQVQIQGAVNNVQSAINSMQQQQMEQYVEFTKPADDTDLANRFSGIEDEIHLLGFYAVANDIILRFRALINEEPPPAELTFPAFGLEIGGQYQGFWDSYTFSFTEWGENFPVLVDALHFATLGALCFAMVRFCNKLINKIWGAQV